MAARRKEEWVVTGEDRECEIVLNRDIDVVEINEGTDSIWVEVSQFDSLIDALTQAQAAYAEGA